MTSSAYDNVAVKKSRLIMEGRLLLNTNRHSEGVEKLLEAADLEELLALAAGTDPNGPQRDDHLRSAASCRALANKPRGT